MNTAYVSLCNTYTRTCVHVSLKHIHKNGWICPSETHTQERLFLCMWFNEHEK
jgi:hypothetical protein